MIRSIGFIVHLADAGLMHNKIYTVSFEPGLFLPGITGIKFKKKWTTLG